MPYGKSNAVQLIGKHFNCPVFNSNRPLDLLFIPASPRQGSFSHTDRGKAVVLSKNTNADTSQAVYLQNTNVTTGLVETEAVHQITFQDMEHPEKCVTLEADDAVFSMLKEGAQGKLMFRGSQLLSFGALQSQNHKDYKFKGIS